MAFKQTGFQLIGLLLMLPFVPAAIADDSVEQPAQPYQCEDSVITKMGYYFDKQPDSGIYVMFKSKLGVTKFKEQTAQIVDRSIAPTSLMAKQKVGDKVQVCLLSTPPKDRACNPDKDPRGRYYRVYNYRQQAAYTGTNGNHLCGGA
jgi:hypothetical protein